MASKCVSKGIIAGIEAAALECPSCMERFTNPKLLPCVHSFCLGCLEKWVKESNGILSCPTCREVSQVPKGGLKNLKNNTFIIGLLDYVTTLEEKSAPTCSCKKDASYFCKNCDELYCTECKDAHRRIKVTRLHIMLTLDEYKSIDPVKTFASKPINCTKHSMEFLFFCDTCKIPVCVGCTQVEHPRGNEHKIIDTKDAFKNFTSRASQLVTASDEKLFDLRAVLSNIKETESLLSSNYSKCKSDITRQVEELHRLIDRRKEDQMQNLERSYRQKLKVTGTQVSEVELAIAKLSSMRGITHNLMSSPNQVMALMSSSGACGKLHEVLKEEVNTEPRESGALRYHPNRQLSQSLEDEVVGKLRGHETYVSPDKSTIQIKRNIEDGRKKFTAIVITRNELDEIIYDMDVKVNGSFGRTDSRQNDEIQMDEMNVTDEKNGRYEFSGSYFAFDRCTLRCHIIDGPNTYKRKFMFGGLYELFTPETKSFNFTT